MPPPYDRLPKSLKTSLRKLRKAQRLQVLCFLLTREHFPSEVEESDGEDADYWEEQALLDDLLNTVGIRRLLPSSTINSVSRLESAIQSRDGELRGVAEYVHDIINIDPEAVVDTVSATTPRYIRLLPTCSDTPWVQTLQALDQVVEDYCQEHNSSQPRGAGRTYRSQSRALFEMMHEPRTWQKLAQTVIETKARIPALQHQPNQVTDVATDTTNTTLPRELIELKVEWKTYELSQKATLNSMVRFTHQSHSWITLYSSWCRIQTAFDEKADTELGRWTRNAVQALRRDDQAGSRIINRNNRARLKWAVCTVLGFEASDKDEKEDSAVGNYRHKKRSADLSRSVLWNETMGFGAKFSALTDVFGSGILPLVRANYRVTSLPAPLIRRLAERFSTLRPSLLTFCREYLCGQDGGFIHWVLSRLTTIPHNARWYKWDVKRLLNILGAKESLASITELKHAHVDEREGDEEGNEEERERLSVIGVLESTIDAPRPRMRTTRPHPHPHPPSSSSSSRRRARTPQPRKRVREPEERLRSGKSSSRQSSAQSSSADQRAREVERRHKRPRNDDDNDDDAPHQSRNGLPRHPSGLLQTPETRPRNGVVNRNGRVSSRNSHDSHDSQASHQNGRFLTPPSTLQKQKPRRGSGVEGESEGDGESEGET